MTIEKEIYQKIIREMPEKPPEIGGIMGGRNGMITHFQIDRGNSDIDYCKCSYIPDIVKINSCIGEWENNNVDFYGIFHCHFGGARTLSTSDVLYIKQIMRNMPERVQKLYFPVIVLPQREMICYYSTIKNKKVNFGEEAITIL